MKKCNFKYRVIPLLLLAICILSACDSNAEVVEKGQQETQKIDINELSDSMENTLEQVNITIKQPVTKNGLSMEILGATLYDKLESKDYTDIPEEGMKYLVVFLSIKNTTGTDDYFNYNYLTAELDGAEIEDTFLLNTPEQYNSIKSDIPDNMITQGYLVWEVPEDWKKLEITYTGWNETIYLEPTIVVTPDDLQMPEEYSEYNRVI